MIQFDLPNISTLDEYWHLIDNYITSLESDYNEAVSNEVADRISYDIEQCKGLLGLLEELRNKLSI